MSSPDKTTLGEPVASGPIRTRRLPELLDDALDLALHGGWRVYLWVAIPLAAIGAVFSLITVQWAGAMSGGDPTALFDGCGAMALLLVLIPVSIVLSMIGYTALFEAANRRVRCEPVHVFEVYRFAIRPRVLATLGLAAVAVLGGTLLLVLPGIFLFLLFSLVVPVLSNEGSWGPAALSRSAQLVLDRQGAELRRFNLVRVLAVFVAYCGVGYSMALIIALPYQVLTQVALWRQVTSGQTADPTQALTSLLWLQVPTNILSSLVGSWVVFYACHCLAMLYRDIRFRAEGDDLEAEIDRWSEAGREIREL